jgi:hypothetical protein
VLSGQGPNINTIHREKELIMSENTLENIIFGLKTELKELKAENEHLKSFIDFKTANIRCDNCKQQVVKDLLTSLMSAEQQLDPLKTGIRWSILKSWCKKYNIEVDL